MAKKLISMLAAALGFLSLSGNNSHISVDESKYREAIRKYHLEIKVPPFYQTEEMKQLEKKIYQKINYQTENFMEDSENVLLARLILGEAVGCSKIEKIAVAYTAINRMKWGNDLKRVILEPYQYSCFNEGTDSSKFLKNPLKYDADEFMDSLVLSKEILQGKYKDPAKGATHYFNPKKVKTPSWAKSMKKIGKIQNSCHIFYR